MIRQFFANWKQEILAGDQSRRAALAARHHWAHDPQHTGRYRWRFGTWWGDDRWSIWCVTAPNATPFTSLTPEPHLGPGWYPDPLETAHNEPLLGVSLGATVIGVPFSNGLRIRLVDARGQWTDYVTRVHGSALQPFLRFTKPVPAYVHGGQASALTWQLASVPANRTNIGEHYG